MLPVVDCHGFRSFARNIGVGGRGSAASADGGPLRSGDAVLWIGSVGVFVRRYPYP